jgi:hypothetical protein
MAMALLHEKIARLETDRPLRPRRSSRCVRLPGFCTYPSPPWPPLPQNTRKMSEKCQPSVRCVPQPEGYIPRVTVSQPLQGRQRETGGLTFLASREEEVS